MTMFIARRRSAAATLSLGLALIAGLGLSGCLTQRVKPTPSAAVLEARQHRDSKAPPPCPAIDAPISVGFGFGEAAIGELAAPAVIQAAQLAACHSGASVTILGQADMHGTEAEQRKLSQDRANAVAAALRERGVAPGRIATQVQGTAPPADATHLVILAEGRRW